MGKNVIFVISGAGGVGKGTIIRGVINSKKYNLIKGRNITTRKQRHADKKDIHYQFISKDEFKRKIKKGEILEYNFLDGEYYGTSKTDIYTLLKNHNILIEVDVNGGMNIKKQISNAVLIFITANLKDIKIRIEKRGDTTKHHLEYRMNLAKQEIEKSKYYDYIVENPEGHPEIAINNVLEIIEKELKKRNN